MNINRIKALTIRHLYLYKRSLPRLMDVFFWPVVSILTWGFLSIYLGKINLNNFNIVSILLGAIILWELLQRMQNAVAITFLEDVWERNFLNLFVTPLKVSEFLISTVILGIIRIIAVLFVMTILAMLLYQFNLFALGFSLIPFILILLIFGFSLGIFNMAIILRFGTSAQILAFGLVFLIQPFSAVFYPIATLPESVSWISYLIPSSYVFEGIRNMVETQGIIQYGFMVKGFLISLVYLIVMLWFFTKMFKKVKREGRLLKLD